MKKVIFLLSFIGVLLINAQSFSQTVDSTKCKVESYGNVGVVSQYICRGIMMNGKPNIQPVLGLKYKGIDLNASGSISVSNNFYELDLIASYTYKIIKLFAIDYYYDVLSNQSYFNFSDTAGFHHVECGLSILPSEKFPMRFTIATIVYSGWDLDASNKQSYTTYIGARYFHRNWELYIAGITGKSYFYLNDVDGFNIIKIGATYNYKIKDFPATIQLCMNPRMEKFHLIFGIVF